jgi:hypothetical protein
MNRLDRNLYAVEHLASEITIKEWLASERTRKAIERHNTAYNDVIRVNKEFGDDAEVSVAYGTYRGEFMLNMKFVPALIEWLTERQ